MSDADKLEIARKALEWYADYTIVEHHPEHKEFDMGHRARKALAQINASDEPKPFICVECGLPEKDCTVHTKPPPAPSLAVRNVGN